MGITPEENIARSKSEIFKHKFFSRVIPAWILSLPIQSEAKNQKYYFSFSLFLSWMKHLTENTDVCCRNIFIAGLHKFSILHPFKFRSVLPILKYPLWGPNDWW